MKVKGIELYIQYNKDMNNSSPNTNCKYCEKSFYKKPSELKKSPNSFCSRSCSAKYNNTHYPKRQVEGACSECGEKCPANLKHCKQCKEKVLKPIKGRLYYFNKTLDEATNSGKRAAKFSTIREYARKAMASANVERKCQNCEYDKHVEVCHIKSISEFALSVKVSEINDINNLVYLCPNCHWEFDKGMLKLNGPG